MKVAAGFGLSWPTGSAGCGGGPAAGDTGRMGFCAGEVRPGVA